MARSRARRDVSPAGGPTAPPPPSSAALALIRIALLFGVLAFGAATTWVVRRGDWMPGRDAAASLRPLGIALWVLAVVGVTGLRLGGTRLAGRLGAAAPAILAWTLGEMVAMFGGVLYFLTGDASWYLIGVTFLVATFVVFPIPRTMR